MQPALVLSCLAFAQLMRSSEAEEGENGRNRAREPNPSRLTFTILKRVLCLCKYGCGMQHKQR